jgi:hypothetical protein
MAAAAVNLLLESLEKPNRQSEKRLFSGVLAAGTSAPLDSAQR